MNGVRRFVCVLSGVAAAAGLVAATTPNSTAVNKAVGQVVFVQAVPGKSLTVTVDGREVKAGLVKGTVVGPIELSSGTHEVTFTGDGQDVEASVEVKAGGASDVVVHRPAEAGGAPIVTVYPTPMKPIGPGKARVLLAHTATTAPADVEVDGTVVFQNIANGEYAQADVPAGKHVVALLPSGVEGDPILGPIEVDLKAGTLTSVYAVGNPKTNSMDVIVREIALEGDGSVAPQGVDTGSAGLVGDVRVLTFTSR